MKTILKVLGAAAVAVAIMAVTIRDAKADRPDFNRGDKRGNRDEHRVESRRDNFRRVVPQRFESRRFETRRDHGSFWDFGFLFAYSPPPPVYYSPPPQPVYYAPPPAVYDSPSPVVYSQPSQMSPAEVKAMAQSRVSDEIIISQIRASRVVYRLTTAEIIDLTNCGVSQRVIDFMINTASS